MLKVHCTNVMGLLHVSVHCLAHGDVIGHSVWSKSLRVGSECPEDELRGLAEGLQQAVRSWEQGEFDFSDDCFDLLPGSFRKAWRPHTYHGRD